MKYIRFSVNGKEKTGRLEGETIIELKDDFLVNRSEKTGKTYTLSEVDIRPPVYPGKIVAIGLNYVKHAEEVKKKLPEEPMMFMVSPSAVIGHQEPIQLPTLERRIEFEAELVVIIGKTAKHVKKEHALDYVFGYTCGNDVTDRHLQKKDIQYTRAKSFHTFKPLGPVIETDLNPNEVDITLACNGVVMQHSNTNDLIFKVEEIIEAVTEVMKLDPGDAIFTGTPAGVAPIKPGDQIEIEIESVGTLVNKVQF